MQYKTIVLELLQAQPWLHEELRRTRTLLSTMNTYAAELKERHNAWKDMIRRAWPDRAEEQIASEALEPALTDLLERLQHEFSTGDTSPLSLDEAMTFVRHHTPPG
jgi:hypothetical protein